MTDPRLKVVELEAKVLQYSGLELGKELLVSDVEIELNGLKRKIHTYECGNKANEVLVLIHGYAGSALMYYKMLKTLAEKFHVFCIDIVGMGLSSKEKFECQSTEETIAYLTGSIDKWREAVGIEMFNLAGHSFGAYVSGQYTLKYPERVKKLSLLSPVGFTKHVKEVSWEERMKEMGFFKRTLFGFLKRFMENAWETKLTPNRFLKEHSWIGNFIVKNYVYKRFGLKDKEADAVYEYLWAMLNLPEGSEISIHYILKPPRAQAHLPLEELITEIKVPVDCYYGEIDYMDSTGAKRVLENEVKKDFVLKTVPKAAHQVTIQSPIELANEIVVSALV